MNNLFKYHPDGPSWRWFAVVGTLLFALLFLAWEARAQTTITEVLPSGTNEFSYNGSTWATGHSTYFIGNRSGVSADGGLIFTTVAIPQGATISSATVKWISGSYRTNDVSLIMYAEDTSSATAFSDLTDFNSKARTTASNSVTITTDVAAEDTIAATCTNAVQEVVNRGDWSSGNDIMIIWEDDANGTNVMFQTYAAAVGYSAVLEVTYTEGGGGETGATTVRRGAIIKGGVTINGQ